MTNETSQPETNAPTQQVAPNNDLLAFTVSAEYCEASILVFAENCSKAKSYAHVTEWLCEFEWTELRCRREKCADIFAANFGSGALQAYTRAEQEILRNLGWYELDEGIYACRQCGLHEWSEIPESTLSDFDEDEPICAGCKEEES